MGRRKRIYEVRRQLLKKARDKKKSKTGTPSIEKEESIIAGSRLQPAATPPPSPGSSRTRSKLPTSAEKRKRFFTMESKEVADTSFVLIKKERLHQLAANTLCSECCTQTMECKITPHQIDTHIKLYCKNCAFVAMDTKGDSDTGKRGIYRLTVMLVYAMMLHGWLFRGVERVIAYIGLSRFTKETYVRYRQYVTEKSIEHTKSMLENNRKKVIAHYGSELGRYPDSDGILNIDVSYDGTWHTRGEKSLLGVGAVIDANTGHIIDYKTMSKFCEACTKKKKNLSKEQFDEWHAGHVDVCHKNYEGSSGGMEAGAAVILWGRSLAHKMRYITFISDGDSSAFLEVCKMNENTGPYGEDHPVRKEECVNHVAKRLGTGLRNLSKQSVMEILPDGIKKRKRSLGGQNRLTENVITHLQHYFRLAVKKRMNTTAKKMREDIMASFYHCSSTDAKPTHQLCPATRDSWCFYNKSIANDEEPKSHSTMKIKFELAADELAQVKAVYDRLTSDEMMIKCLRGKTQNPNESLHSRIWRICPKHKNANKPMLDFAVAQATANYNFGYEASCLDTALGVERTQIMKTYLKRQDERMNVKPKIKMRNKKLQQDLEYAAGGF